MQKIYIVKYGKYNHSDREEVNVFATTNKAKATRYVKKFNKMLSKWSVHYKKYEDKRMGMPWIQDKYLDTKLHRWSCIKNTNIAFIEGIEVR